MSIVLTYTTVATLTGCSFGGFLLFKQYATTQNVLYLVAGFCLYGLSNCLFLFVISDGNAARAFVLSSAFQILLALAAGWYLREPLTWVHFVSAALVVTAVMLPLLFAPATPRSTTTSHPPVEEIRDA